MDFSLPTDNTAERGIASVLCSAGSAASQANIRIMLRSAEMKRRAAKLKEVAVAIKESTEIVAALNARIDAALAVRDCAR